ncbi:MAG: oligosaccharide flippase family protein [Nitrospinota bacterium]|nr:oligosaccharide flippase family protein [Nitrospinota bacterium]
MIGKKSSVMMFVRLSGLGLALVVNVIIARSVGEKGFGLYSYIYSWLILAYSSLTIGLQTVSLKMVGEYMAKREWGLLRGYITTVERALVAVSITVAIGICLLVVIVGDRAYGAGAEFASAAFLLPFYALFMLRMFILQSLGKSIEAFFLGLVARPLVLSLLILCATYILGIKLHVLMLVLFDIPPVLVALAGLTIFMRKSLPQEYWASERRTKIKQWFDLAKPIYITAGLGVVLSQLDVIMLGMFSAPQEDLGVFAAAGKLSHLIPIGLMSVNAVAVPIMSRQWAAGNMDDLQETVSRMSLFIMLVTLPIVMIMVFGGEMLLSIFGQTFTRGYAALMIMTAGQAVNAFAGPVGYIMNVTRLQWHASLVIFVAVLLDISLNCLLIPTYGIIGAAISFSASLIFWNATMFVVIASKLGIYSFPFIRRRSVNDG